MLDALENIPLSSTYPLAASVTSLLCDVLWLPNYRPTYASVSTFMTLSGKSLENYVQETLTVLVSEESALGYLEWMAASFTRPETEPPYHATEQELQTCMRKKIPGKLYTIRAWP